MANTVSFDPAINFGVGDAPYSVAVGDFNGDGKLDLVSANLNSDNVSVLLGQGNGSFAPATNFEVDIFPKPVAVGDFNGDGKQDLVTANSVYDGVSVLLGQGNGSFAPATLFGVGRSSLSVAVGDFNGDGKQDLVTASGNVSVLLGQGDGNFGPATSFGVGVTPASVAVGDFNGDGKQDLVAANAASNNVSVLLGQGNGRFASATNFGVGDAPNSVAVGDFNGDGKQDLVTANAGSSTVSVLLGQGNGSFAPATNFGVGFGVGALPYSVAVGDFNGDGKQDLVSANIGTDTVSVLLGQGDGSFAPAANFGVGIRPESVAVGDFNGDGKQDLVTANLNSDTVSVLLNTTVPNTAPTDLALSPSTVDENVAANTPIGSFSTTDAEGGSFTYALVSGDGSTDNGAFSIEDNQLKLTPSPNFEDKPSYNIRVKTTDANGLSVEKALTIGVNDVNEAPTAIALSANTVAENAAGAVIGTLTVTDPDTNAAFRNNTLAVTDARFEVVNSQLKLKAGVSLDYEAIPNGQLNLTLTATDAGNTTLTQSQAVVLNVTDLVENTAPTATGETVSTSQNTSITVELGDNVSDTEGLAGATLTVTSATNGTITSIDQDARLITFTPTTGFSGTASFQYTITDAGNLASNAATVTVEVGTIQSTGNKDQDIAGNEGNDTISAGNGKDILRGFGGKDTLLGNNGNDTFYGGNGEDLLTGGNGADTFVLAKGEGKDTITDFKAGTDLIGLSGSLSFSALSFSGNNILNGSEVLATLTGVNTSTLTQSNFVSV